jgi:hypothetical protein
MIQLKKITDTLFKNVDSDVEPYFQLTKENEYWHQSGYGCLLPHQVIIIVD